MDLNQTNTRPLKHQTPQKKLQQNRKPFKHNFYKSTPKSYKSGAKSGFQYRPKACGWKRGLTILQKKDTVSFFDVYRQKALSQNKWHTQWDNLHLHYQSLLVRGLVRKFYFLHGLYLNKLHIQIGIDSVRVIATGLGAFKKPKAQKNIKQYFKDFKSPTILSKFGRFLMEVCSVSRVQLNFHQLYLPRRFRIESTQYAFKKQKRLFYFWETLQIVYTIFKGYGSANLLGSLIYTYIRKNPKRVAFLTHIHRLLVWHYKSVSSPKIQGVRIEVKGRFNAKSRARKRIFSVGCVKMHVKSSNVDFVHITPITKFGSLSIKVWICPIPSSGLRVMGPLKIIKDEYGNFIFNKVLALKKEDLRASKMKEGIESKIYDHQKHHLKSLELLAAEIVHTKNKNTINTVKFEKIKLLKFLLLKQKQIKT